LIEFSVSTSGLEFDEVAHKISGKLRQKLIERLTDIAFEAVFWGAPVKTGYLASTVYKDVGFGEAKVGAAASYAAAVEYGTAPHEIRPVNGGVLAFEVAGKMIFTPLVHHPGTRANPFMQRALDEALGKVDSVFADLWLELVGG
jgi:HK97 gp10 family phage protein